MRLRAVGCALVLSAACAPVEPPADDVLTQDFPAQARAVLASSARFVRGAAGYTVEGAGGLTVTLPAEAGPIVMHAGGAEIRVMEIGLRGVARAAGAALAYPREGGTSYWTPLRGAAEEWLLLGEGQAWSGSIAASWDVSGAVPVPSERGVALRSAEGVPLAFVSAPHAYAKGGREVPVQLRVDGPRIDLEVDANGEEVLVDPVWTATQPLTVARMNHTATTLADGRVLVSGGATNPAGQLETASVEIYDPTTGLWSSPAGLTMPRALHTATLAPNGHVFIFGGTPGGTPATYEDVNPSLGSTGGTTTSTYPHVWQLTSVLLNDGTILLAGGTDGELSHSNTGIVDPSFDLVSDGPPLSLGRFAHAAAVDPATGSAYVIGGMSFFQPVADVEVLSITSTFWNLAASMNVPRAGHTATALQDGRILVVGGSDVAPSPPHNTAEVYDPTKDSWTLLSSTMADGRTRHTATRLADGTVLIAGGEDGNFTALTSTEIFQPGADTFSPGPALAVGRVDHRAALTSVGVLVTGGSDESNVLTSAELYAIKKALGVPCSLGPECMSGTCVDGVCCDTSCGAAGCGACSVANGSDVDGTCKLLDGAACSTGNSCTTGDKCQGGTCVPGGPRDCTSKDPCRFDGACDPDVGACVHASRPDGAPCPGGQCVAGGCVLDSDAGVSVGAGPGSSGAGAGDGATTGDSGAGPSGAGGSSSTNGGAGGNGDTQQGGGCQVGGGGVPGAAGWLVAFGLAALHLRRRLETGPPKK